MVDDRRETMRLFVAFLREQLQVTLDLQQKVIALTRTIESDPKFLEKHKAVLKALATDESVRPNSQRIAQISELFSSLERLL